MYSWGDDTTDWRGARKYSYKESGKARRAADAARAKAKGPRTYSRKRGPNEQLTDPRKKVRSTSKNPLIVAVDVTGSMATWPREIFDRLPLLYNTLSQYRDDLEVCFVAIGDWRFDRWPLQTTGFAHGYDLETQLGALHGEGGGGDAPEGYGLFAHWVDQHVEVPNAEEPPFLIVFGDVTMHEKILAKEIQEVCGDDIQQDRDAIATWRRVASKWNCWFLRRPGGVVGDPVDQQWAAALGDRKVAHIEHELRAVDYAMGIVSSTWEHFGDFKDNMLSRQDTRTVEALSQDIRALGPLVLKCPSCGAPVPPHTVGRASCGFCNSTLLVR